MKLHSVLFAAAAIGASALTLGLAAGPAQAEPDVVVTGRPADLPTAIVRYGDLNLASEQGKARLMNRVDFAADKLCGKPRVIEYHVATEARACRTAVFASAEPQIKELYAAAESGQQLALGDVGAMTLSAK